MIRLQQRCYTRQGVRRSLLLTHRLVLLPVLFLTPSRTISGALACAAEKQLRFPLATATCASVATLSDSTHTFDIWHSKEGAKGDAGDEWPRRRPLRFLHKRRADVLAFAATTQGVILVFQRERNGFFCQEFAVRTMLPPAAPFRQCGQESFPVRNILAPQVQSDHSAHDPEQQFLDLFCAVPVQREYVGISHDGVGGEVETQGGDENDCVHVPFYVQSKYPGPMALHSSCADKDGMNGRFDIRQSVGAVVLFPQSPLPVGHGEPKMRIDPIQARTIRYIQDRKAVQLEVVQIPGCSDLVMSKWDRKSVEGKAIWSEWFRDRSDDLSR